MQNFVIYIAIHQLGPAADRLEEGLTWSGD